MLASSGIDYDVKIWQPILEESVDIRAKIEMAKHQKKNPFFMKQISLSLFIFKITQRNKLMLDENKKTIFIPVQMMVPALRLCIINRF